MRWDFNLPFYEVRFQFTFLWGEISIYLFTDELRIQFTFLRTAEISIYLSWGEISIYLSMRWDFNLPFHWWVENSIYLSEDCWEFNLPFYELRFQFTFSLTSWDWEFNLPLKFAQHFNLPTSSSWDFNLPIYVELRFQFTHLSRAEISIYPAIWER